MDRYEKIGAFVGVILFVIFLVYKCYEDDISLFFNPPQPVAVQTLAAPKPEPEATNYQIIWQGQQPVYASKVMPLFQKQCAQLLGYSQDIETIKAMEWESYDFEKERGWADKAIVIDIKIKANGQQIPGGFHAWGHTCTYKIEANGNEMSATKEPCAQLCNMPPATTSNSYVKF